MDIPWIFLLLMMCQVTASKRVHKWRTHVKSHCDQEHLPSFMWKIKRQSSPPSYLFGTIHVPYTLVWDSIPLTIKKAFEESDCIYFELDLLSKYTISALSNCQILPHGKRLTDVLPADLYRRLKRHLDYVRSILPKWMTPDQRGRGLYSEYLFNAITGNWERKRPVWVMLMINSLTESDIKSRGVPVLDLYLAQEAQRMNKWTGAVERVEEQCLPMNDLSATHVIFALNTTLVQQENIRRGLSQPSYTTQDLIHHYNCGSLSGIIFNQVPSLLQSSSSEEAVKEQESARLLEEYFRAELVIKRNLKMSRKIMDILQSDSKKSYFFAFGAGHFIGRDSIIEVLRASGYEVERVTDVHNQEDRGSLPLHKSQRRNACGFRPCSNGSFVQWKHRHARQKNLNAHRNDKIGEEEILGHSSQSKSGQIDENSLINKRHSKLYLEDGGTYGKGTNDLPSLGLLSSTSHSRRHSFPKKFNDLWVRLETANDKVPLLIRPREDILNEVHTGNSYFHALSTTASASSSLSLCVHHSIFNKLLFIFMSQQLSYMTKSSLIRHKSEL